MKEVNYYKAAELAYDGLELEIVQAFMVLTNLRRAEMKDIWGSADFRLLKINFTIDQLLELISEEFSVYEVLNIIELGYIATKSDGTWNDLTFNEDSVKILIDDYI